jgi:hypothetical protein
MRAVQKLFVAFVFVGFLSLVAENVVAQVPPTFTFNENGVATFDYHNGTVVSVVGTPGKDPLSPYQAAVYDVSQLFDFDTTGDVILREPGTSETSDLIRFYEDGKIYFLSEFEAGEVNPEMADSVPPGMWGNVPHQALVAYFDEVGPEGGLNGLFNYRPTLFQPGGGESIEYNIISDVPEPTSFVMFLGLGVAGLLSYGWRRWRA